MIFSKISNNYVWNLKKYEIRHCLFWFDLPFRKEEGKIKQGKIMSTKVYKRFLYSIPTLGGVTADFKQKYNRFDFVLIYAPKSTYFLFLVGNICADDSSWYIHFALLHLEGPWGWTPRRIWSWGKIWNSTTRKLQRRPRSSSSHVFTMTESTNLRTF